MPDLGTLNLLKLLDIGTVAERDEPIIWLSQG
jgi:hypothetical protein